MASGTPAGLLENLAISPKTIMAALHSSNDTISALDLPPPTMESQQDVPEMPPQFEPPAEFLKFSELPSELRLKIWDEASFFQRDINLWLKTLGELSVSAYTAEDSTTHELFKSHEFVTNTAPPTVLQICKESRVVGLTHYRLSFGTSYEFANLSISTTPHIYVNWDCDRICLLWPQQFQSHKSRSFKTLVNICQENRLRYLALNVLRDAHWPYVEITTAVHSLKEVLLFGSTAQKSATYSDALNIGFVNTETLAMIYPDLWRKIRNHSWAIRLEIPRRDLAKFFNLSKVGNESEGSLWVRQNVPFASNSPEIPWGLQSDLGNDEVRQPPRIETGYITINGFPELSDWNW
ncbi:uncharacterized protein LY89DRAFT_41698 [Mollisia scopiformis]|uniref:2EXR domain-containing protein n=1 Tax=Mollisia scopiformis TaxID=149040 RepID=A0A194XDF0_MOLSC|nr:uncharacterized protein LY89DRAFT_41698 [Mollisia scopiformis]KUJ18205.1 hypothetical protein LY89DRAFT_41698 [Mollisia scopiformis]